MVTVWISQPRPGRTEEIVVQAMIDSGADVTVIGERWWPGQWETTFGGFVTGVGGAKPVYKAITTTTFKVQDQDRGALIATLKPIVLTEFHGVLLGHDCMQQMKIGITNLG